MNAEHASLEVEAGTLEIQGQPHLKLIGGHRPQPQQQQIYQYQILHTLNKLSSVKFLFKYEI